MLRSGFVNFTISFGNTTVRLLQVTKRRRGSALQRVGCEEETADDGKIARMPNWRSDRMNKWMDEQDRQGTDLWKVARNKRVDGPVLHLHVCKPGW